VVAHIAVFKQNYQLSNDQYAGDYHRARLRLSGDEWAPGFLEFGGVIGAAFSSVLLRQHSTARQNLFAAAVCMQRDGGDRVASAVQGLADR
jgi:hypothetical protein